MRIQLIRRSLFSLALFATTIPWAFIGEAGATTSQSLAYRPTNPDNPKLVNCSCAWEPYSNDRYIPAFASIKLPRIRYCPLKFPQKLGKPSPQIYCPHRLHTLQLQTSTLLALH